MRSPDARGFLKLSIFAACFGTMSITFPINSKTHYTTMKNFRIESAVVALGIALLGVFVYFGL